MELSDYELDLLIEGDLDDDQDDDFITDDTKTESNQKPVDIDEKIRNSEKEFEYQARLMDKIEDIRKKQQMREIEIGKHVVDFISYAKHKAIDEVAELQKHVNEAMKEN